MTPINAWGAAHLDLVYSTIEYVSLATARPLGATLLFTPFVWGRISSGIIRATFGLALSLPTMATVWRDPVVAIADLQPGYLFCLIKEFGLGLALGLLVSLPLEAIGAAGVAVDSVRRTGSLPGPDGDSTALGQLFMAIGLWLFATLGGFWRFSDMIYASYGLWPINRPLPPFQASSLRALFEVVAQAFRLLVVLAGPLITIMLLIDLSLLVANRLGKQMNILDLSMSLKSIVIALAAPFYALIIVRVVTGQFPALFDLRLLNIAFHR